MLKEYLYEHNTLYQFIKFSITGGLGTVTNLVIFFILSDKIGLPEIPVSLFCFLIAGTQNYIINEKWSFTENGRKNNISIKKWLLFFVSSLVGLIVNIGVMELVIRYWKIPYKVIAQAFGILSGMIINFFSSKFMVFRNA
jgi:dolichol-phosphate mannosyltransferase